MWIKINISYARTFPTSRAMKMWGSGTDREREKYIYIFIQTGRRKQKILNLSLIIYCRGVKDIIWWRGKFYSPHHNTFVSIYYNCVQCELHFSFLFPLHWTDILIKDKCAAGSWCWRTDWRRDVRCQEAAYKNEWVVLNTDTGLISSNKIRGITLVMFDVRKQPLYNYLWPL